MTDERLTSLLHAWARGEAGAVERLIPLVYQDLRKIAHRQMRGERADHTLEATALVHEAFVKLSESPQRRYEDRHHFFAVAARLMRHVLVDMARARRAAKRGGNVPKVALDEALHGSGSDFRELVAIDDALAALAGTEPRRAQVVELRFFGGYTVEETARVLDISPDTVMRDWKYAKAWLWRAMKEAALS